MAVGFSNTNKPINPRGNDASPKGYNRAELYTGKALDFDGVNDYVQCDNVDTLSTSDFTISYFFKWESTGDNWGTTQGSAGTNLALLTGKDGSGVIRFAFWGNDLDAPASLTPAQNEWSFLSFTYNRTTKERKIYINGILAAEDVSASNPNPTANNFQIGAFTAIGGYYNNQVSNVKVFNTALTAAQVADLYNNPEKIVPTGVADSALKLYLPMQEGAGTTAYDGSGNGNHGTISGATYTHGIGAPVAQTAVIDWNKLYDFDGTNDEAYSSSYIDTTGTKTYKVHFNSHDVTQGDQQVFQFWNVTTAKGMAATINFAGTNSAILGLRGYASSASFNIQSWSGLTNNTFYELELTIDWAAESITSATLNGESADGNVNARLQTTNNGLYLGSRVTGYYLNGIINYFEVVGDEKWTNASGFKSESGSYDMTIVGSPSQILAPQGLTTGRDITGVNLFENVRKQGALNLDGNSYAEVHDNASLDITDAISLECWVYWEEAQDKGIIGKYDYYNDQKSYLLYQYPDTGVRFYASPNGTSQSFVGAVTTFANGNWYHLVGVYDGAELIIYVNGVKENSLAYTSDIFSSNNVLEIGRYGQSANASHEYNGPIAQPRIYNRALTAAEVLRNYNSGKNTYTND